MIFSPENKIYHLENGVFSVQVWRVNNETHATAVQVDNGDYKRGYYYSAEEGQEAVIHKAIQSIIEE